MKTCRSVFVCLAWAGFSFQSLTRADTPTSPAGKSFAFTLDNGGITSAGIYDAQGRLVRTLWSMQARPAGQATANWDAMDDLGQPAPPGDYQYRIIINGSIYTNVGAIGQNGATPDVLGHVPLGTYGVAIDADGAVYTANSWDEPGDDLKKWDKSGNAVWSFNYKIRNGKPNGLPISLCVDDRYIYTYINGYTDPKRDTHLIGRYDLATGNAAPFPADHPETKEFGHILVLDFSDKVLPPGTPKEDEEIVRQPLRSLAVSGDHLWVTDARDNQALCYDKKTGAKLSDFAVKFPTALAIDAQGQVCIGHEHKYVTVYSPEGKRVRDLVSDLENVVTLAFGPQGQLYVADAGAGQVKIYDVTGKGKARQTGTLGTTEAWGDRPAGHFHTLRSMAVDSDGNVVTIDRGEVAHLTVTKWSPSGELLWEKFSNEWMDSGNYGRQAPDFFYTNCLNSYRLTDAKAGAWEFIAHGFQGPANHIIGRARGPVRVVRISGKDFIYQPEGDGMQIYRLDGKFWHLAALVGGREPGSDGEVLVQGPTAEEWSWHDAKGTGQPEPDEIVLTKKHEDSLYLSYGMSADSDGNLWFAGRHTHTVMTIPMGLPDALGNPTYDWAKLREAAPRDTSPLNFDPICARRADDGSIYAFGACDKWPPNPAAWMGGIALVKFDANGQRRWAIRLPEVCVGMDTIPGGNGVILGAFQNPILYHVNADGLVIGMTKAGLAMGNTMGWLDTQAAVAVNRDPRDNLVDVFVEDDYLLRIGWFRIDDHDIQTVAGALRIP